MKTIISISILLCMLAQPVSAEEKRPPELQGLEQLTNYLNLKPDDISFRSDYTDPDQFRLKLISDLMKQPLGMIDYTASLKAAYSPGQPEVTAAILYSDLKTVRRPNRTRPYQPSAEEISRSWNLIYLDMNLNQLLTRAALCLDVIIPKSAAKAFSQITGKQKKFLRNEFKELIVSSTDEEFMSPAQIDSLEKLEESYVEQFVKFGHLIDKDPLLKAGIDCLRDMILEAKNLQKAMRSGQGGILKKAGYMPNNADLSTYLGRQPGWKIGGTGNDYYTGDYKFILDLGGDDIYDLSYNPARPHGVIIIDLSGDDRYRGTSDFALGSGCFSVGMLIDLEGNDRYDAKSFSLGSGYFGMGILYDASGDDRYDGDTHVQAAASFGMGLLIDEGGRDIYNAALYSQGFGFTEGMGVIYDRSGADAYYAGGKYKDILRYKDHYLSLSQGFGYGLRPWMSGGIGGIVDIEGNDAYYSDIFAQAASYWWSLGVIYDSSGNDNYQCFQYGQGAATHMTLAALVDNYGNDVYNGKGLMQGCGHDYSCGLILDRHGDDQYTAYDLSQGAGSANGAGLLIDNEGDDRYFVKSKANTQGYGNPRRDYGSIGLFLDLGGADQYWGNGSDNAFWRTNSKWGGGCDFELNPPDSTEEEQK